MTDLLMVSSVMVASSNRAGQVLAFALLAFVHFTINKQYLKKNSFNIPKNICVSRDLFSKILF